MSVQPDSTDAAAGVVALLPGMVWQHVDDGVMLLDVAKGQYFELNASGARMFQLLLEHATMEQVQTVLLSEFEIDAARLQLDLTALINSLRAADLIAEGARPDIS